MGYFEIAKRNSTGGRRKIKMALHEIYDDNETTNKNGLHWTEINTTNSMQSAVNIPICVEFTDEEKEIPFGHGLTGIDSAENEPLFENSEVVGTITNVYIDTVEINSESKKILVGDGYIYQQRYPKFTKWLLKNVTEDKVMSSIEIMGTPENNNLIVYEEDKPTSEFRTPKEYLYSGTAILAVEPADDAAMILQMNNLNIKSNKESEVNSMDEKSITLIADAVRNAVTETNTKNAEYENTITELNQTVADKEAKIVELNASVAELQKALDELKSQMDTAWDERRILEEELAKARVAERLGELNTALAEFTEEEKAFAQAEIAEFNEKPMEYEINSIVNKIYAEIGKQSKETAKKAVVETNSIDIYSDITEPVSRVSNVNNYEDLY